MLFLIVVLLKSRIVLKIYFQKCLILNVFIYQQNCLTQLNNKELGSIKGESTVLIGFEAKHGTAFTEALSLTYKISFVFALQS